MKEDIRLFKGEGQWNWALSGMYDERRVFVTGAGLGR
jgi:hypothetical protein